MINLKYFEAFSDRNISSIIKYLNKTKAGKDDFIEALKSISKDFDKPLSLINGKYSSAKVAKKYNNSNVKFWFSLEDGFICSTISNNDELFDRVNEVYEMFLSKNGILSDRVIKSIKHDFNKGEFIKTNLSDLKTGDRVLAQFDQNRIVDSYIFREEMDDAFQIHIIQNTYSDSPNNKNLEILDCIKKFNKRYSYRVYRKYKDSQESEYNIAGITTYKYIKNDSELYQNLSNIPSNIIDFANLIKNNIPINEYIDMDIYNLIESADYALIVDQDLLKKLPNLSDIVKEKPLDRINNQLYKDNNKKRWREKLGRKPNIKSDDDEIETLRAYLKYKSYNRSNSYQITIDYLLDLYSNGEISAADIDRLSRFI